jgi:DNA-binding NarL/FixJ family response regulator
MNKIILADNQAIFRAGTAKVLAMEDDVRIIAQCPDCDRLYHAVETFRGSVVIFASALKPDFSFLMQRIRNSGSRAIVIAENNESSSQYTSAGVSGILYRNVTSSAMIDCVRRVLHGENCVQPVVAGLDTQEEDMVGTRVRDRLTPKEMKIVALIVQGCKNKEIATRLGTTEQVIKNYLRSIYDKTGVSDRLELALFTIHHRTLAEAAAEAGNLLQLNSA